MKVLPIVLPLAVCLVAGQAPSLRFDDLPAGVQHALIREQITRESFPAYIEKIRQSTADREDQGENDHMIFYALQSRHFTSAPPIEPAISARVFVEASSVPPDAERRLREFAKALDGSDTRDERMNWFRKTRPHQLQSIHRAYAHSMQVLYRKEFQKESAQSWYQTRGHSTDTAIIANYAVWQGLSVLHGMQPNFRAQKVLIVGPGLNFAPRTGLDEGSVPQSYQPFAALDAIRALGMGNPAVHCFDINDRVVQFFQRVPALTIYSEPGDADYKSYFQQLGRAIGTTTEQGWKKTIALNRDVSVTAEKLNILTDRATGEYDLVIATNVLLYFNRPELLLALGNIHRIMKPGAVLLHNDLRPNLDADTEAAGFSPLAARSIRISPTTYDTFALYTRFR